MPFVSRILGTALLIGAGALAIAAVVSAPKIVRTAKPLIRGGLKRGFELYEQARTAVAEMTEELEDLVAEAKADLGAAHTVSSPSAAATPDQKHV